jgi:hypothetical protein
MTQSDAAAAAPYTDATRARVLLAYEACELAELARAVVPIGAHDLRSDGSVRAPGTVLADAVHILGAARQLLEAAAVFERLGGFGRPRVGEVLGVPAHLARARFATAEAHFRERLRSPGDTTWLTSWRTYTAREPLEAAHDLDDWVLRHADDDREASPAPVSGGLARTDPAATDRTP